MLEARDESVVDGEKNQCVGAGKHQTGVDTGIEGGTSSDHGASRVQKDRTTINVCPCLGSFMCRLPTGIATSVMVVILFKQSHGRFVELKR